MDPARAERRVLPMELQVGDRLPRARPAEAFSSCLKAAVTVGSEESAALGRGSGFGAKLFSPEPFAVKCTRQIAQRLLAVAQRFCPDVVPEIRAAIHQEKQ